MIDLLILAFFGLGSASGVAYSEHAAIVRAGRDPWLQGGDR